MPRSWWPAGSATSTACAACATPASPASSSGRRSSPGPSISRSPGGRRMINAPVRPLALLVGLALVAGGVRPRPASSPPSRARRRPPPGLHPPRSGTARRPARPARRRRDADRDASRPPTARSSSTSRPTCRRSRPATSSRWRSAATTTASSSTGSCPASSSRAATRDGRSRDPVGTGGPGYTIQDEPVTATYRRGTVAMARTAAAELRRLAVLHRPRRRGAPDQPSERQHLPDHRRRDVRHGDGRRDRRGRPMPSSRPIRSS